MKKISIMIILVFLSFSLYAYDFEFFGFSVDFPSAVELSKSISNDGTFKLYLKPSDNGYYFNQNYIIDVLDRRFSVHVYGVIDDEVIPISISSKNIIENLVEGNSFNFTTYGSSDERRYVSNKLDLLSLEVPAGSIIGTDEYSDFETLETYNGLSFERSYSWVKFTSYDGLVDERLIYKFETPQGNKFSGIYLIANIIFEYSFLYGAKNTDFDLRSKEFVSYKLDNKWHYILSDDPRLEMILDKGVVDYDDKFIFYTIPTENLASYPLQDDRRIQFMKAMDEAMKTLTFSEPPSSSILGVVNDDRVRVRSNYNLSSETLGHVNTGEEVIILDRSSNTQQIGDMNDYWYRVISKETALKGWMYGAFLDLK